MALELRQQLKLSQQLVMTPQLQQAIRLLQLSRIDLVETVHTELMENPFLEEVTDNNQHADALAREGVNSHEREQNVATSDGRSNDAEAVQGAPASQDGYDKDLERNADWSDYMGEFASSSNQMQGREYELPEEMTSFEARYASQPSLEGHLMWQLRLSRLSDAEKDIGEIIVGNIGSSGYLQASIEEISTMGHCSEEDAERVLGVIQRFDPVGIAARTPQESLLTQIDVLGYSRDPVLVALVRDHLEDLEKRRYKPLLKKFKIDLEDLREYIDIIQGLDPMPGSSFGGSDPVFVSPDVFVYKYDGEFVIVLNDDGLPHLQLSSMYDESMADLSSSDKEFFQEKVRSAAWLIKSLYQRQRTLYKAVESIIRHQEDFFNDGVAKLRPLILRDIAEDIGMHESTVSRITTNKFVATPHGVFELKFFFNSALELDDGSQVGSESVKALIKKLLTEEDPREPLSDERIGEILKEQLQVNIARRTVAKYRTAMGIPSSSKRKEVF